MRTFGATLGLALLLTACNAGKKAEPEKKTSAEQPKAEPAAEAPKTIPAPPDVAAPPEDATKTDSGLASKVLEPGGGGEHPQAWDDVTVHYTGWTTDGKMFDSSRTPRPGQAETNPHSFNLGRVIPGWTEGVQLMTKGEKRRFWIPEDLAYKGRMGAPQGMLVFDVELVDFSRRPAPPPVPEDVQEPPKDAKKTKSGLHTKLLSKGSGKRRPDDNDAVKIHYTGWTTDGKMFDSTIPRDTPVSFKLTEVIEGWKEGIQLMTAGEKRRLWIPPELAYQGRPGRPQGMVVFDLELLDIVTPVTPKDVKAPPKDAEKTESGLASKLLEKGTGTEHPEATSVVRVHYSGWTTDGKMFDSSITRGQPAEFPLNGVIKGWTEGVQLMVEGEKRRFWIPEELAYQGKMGAPKGMLVFDVELLEIVK